MMKKINAGLLRELMEKSRISPRRRINFNFHEGSSDPLQRMLNAMQPGTYLQPHKHENPDKREVFIALTGRFALISFDNEGRIANHMILDPKQNDHAAEIGPGIYHTIICLAPDSIIYELKDGPYDPGDDKRFASFAPKEGTPGCIEYLNKLLQLLNIPLP